MFLFFSCDIVIVTIVLVWNNYIVYQKQGNLVQPFQVFFRIISYVQNHMFNTENCKTVTAVQLSGGYVHTKKNIIISLIIYNNRSLMEPKTIQAFLVNP